VQAPAGTVVFPQTKLDGRTSYELRGDIGDWTVTDGSAGAQGWQVAVHATSAIAADTGLGLAGSRVRMRVPVPQGQATAPSIAAGGADGFVALNGDSATGALIMARSAPAGSPGTWRMTQHGTDDLALSLPYDTRAVRYDTTITFTVSPGL
jgi:hypothetical protein